VGEWWLVIGGWLSVLAGLLLALATAAAYLALLEFPLGTAFAIRRRCYWRCLAGWGFF
jgi:uncharacterized membrane protein HdeD (DUF308 family)